MRDCSALTLNAVDFLVAMYVFNVKVGEAREVGMSRRASLRQPL